MTFYAIKPQATAYHIIEERGGNTLCGLKVAKIQQKGSVGTLYMVRSKPEGRTFCKNCERLSRENARYNPTTP